MKKRWISLLLAVALLLGLAQPVCASFDDTEHHWARKNIDRAVELGLFTGMSETEFAPDAPMTRAMFVTVLGRLGKVSKADWQCDYLTKLFSDVEADRYYSPFVAWAVHHGITNGTGDRHFSPNSNITREQMATLFANFLQVEGYRLTTEADEPPSYSDEDTISGWARQSVALLSTAGMLKGFNDGSGGLEFRPKKNATRAECATMFCRLLDAMEPDWEPVLPTSITLEKTAISLRMGEVQFLNPTIAPNNATNLTVLWYSDNPQCVSVDEFGTVYAVQPGTTEIHAVTASGVSASCQVTVEPLQLVADGGMSYEEKCMLVYGEVVSEPRLYYSTEEEALANQTAISVQTWVIGNDGEKYTRNWTIKVHRALAATVEQIMLEIYNSPEKPPIHSLGGWRWRSYEKSEHNMGLALDLNYVENPFVYKGNDPYAAGFRPGEDPYSIPVGGTIDQIFAKYGFRRGIYWNNGNRDYMHYSFFGT